MLSPNPRPDLIELMLPMQFFKEASALTKYNDYVRLLNGHLITIQDMINESLQGINIPGWGFAVTESKLTQTSSSGQVQDTVHNRPFISENELAETNQITLTFRHCDSYVTYFCMLEHFMHWYSFENRKRYCIDSLPMRIKSVVGHTIAIVKFDKLIFSGMTGLDLGFNKLNRDFTTFNCTFTFDGMDFDFELPKSTSTPFIPIITT